MTKQERDVLFRFSQALTALRQMRYRWVQEQPSVVAAQDALEKAGETVHSEEGWETDGSKEDADREALLSARCALDDAEAEAETMFHGWLATHSDWLGPMASTALRQYDASLDDSSHRTRSVRTRRNEDHPSGDQ